MNLRDILFKLVLSFLLLFFAFSARAEQRTDQAEPLTSEIKSHGVNRSTGVSDTIHLKLLSVVRGVSEAGPYDYTYSVENIGDVAVRLEWNSVEEGTFQRLAKKAFFDNPLKPGEKHSFTVKGVAAPPTKNDYDVMIYTGKPHRYVAKGIAPAYVPK